MMIGTCTSSTGTWRLHLVLRHEGRQALPPWSALCGAGPAALYDMPFERLMDIATLPCERCVHIARTSLGLEVIAFGQGSSRLESPAVYRRRVGRGR